MSDLIKREDVQMLIRETLKKLKAIESDMGFVRKTDMMVIANGMNIRLKKIPTAYNPDKVVKKLELCQLSNNGEYKHLNMPIIKANEIVKGGGVE